MHVPVLILYTLASGRAAVSASSLLLSHPRRDVSPDMTCGNTEAGTAGYTCPDDLCCSAHGWCGTTTDYCGTGCQGDFGSCTNGSDPGSGPIVSPDNTCGTTGAGTAGYTCPSGVCCSQYGYCGNTTDYCDDGCQSAFGTCSPGSGDGGGGEDGRCGADFDDAVCNTGVCCSSEGYCGTTDAHCKAPDCQFEYGPGCDANKVPSGTNTTTIPRTKVGKVLYGGAGVYDCVKEGTVALTFDDGPSSYTSDLLDLLAQYGAKATFFITGVNNNKGEIDDASLPWPAVIRRMYAEGHQVASHTWSHADLSAVAAHERLDEMVKNEMALRNVLGLVPAYMRPPYSSCTDASGCAADMAALGYHVVYFDLDTEDYLHDDPAAIQESKDIVDAFFAAGPGDALSIAHDIHEQTVYNLTGYMLQALGDRGYSAVTVGDCLDDPVANWYRQA